MSHLPPPDPSTGARRRAGVDAPGDPHVRDDAAGGALVVSPTRPGRVLAVVIVVLLLAEGLAAAVTAGIPPPLRWYDAATELRVEMMRDRDQVDVVFAGTSMAWQGLVPRVFTEADPSHRSAFNAGLDGGVPVVTARWLTSTVTPILQPEVVVWGLSTLDLAPAYGDQQLRAWTSSLQGRPGPLGAAERAASAVSTLAARRTQLRRPAEMRLQGRAELARDRARAHAVTGPDGERLDFDAGRTPEAAAVQRTRLQGFTPDVADMSAVVEAVLALRDQGIDVVLAELPVPPAFVELHERGRADLQQAGAAIAAMAAELDVAHVPLGRDYGDEDFVDFTHLTAQAAARFTADVAQAMTPYTRPRPQQPVGGTEPLASWVGDASADAVLHPVRLAAITQVGCAGGRIPTAAAQASEAAVAELGDPTARELLGALLPAAQDVVAACGTEVAWRRAMIALLDVAEPAVRHLEQALPAPRPATPAGTVAAATADVSTRDLAVYAEHAYERLNWLLEGAANARLSRSEVWWSYAERGHVARFDAAAAAGDVADTVVLGSSQARTGFDAELLTQTTGAATVNAAIDGGTVDLTRRWAPYVIDRLRPRRVVLVVSGVDFLTVVGPPCPTDSHDAFAAASLVAREAFAGVPWLDGAAPLEIVADPGAGAPLPSPLVTAYEPDEGRDHPTYTEEEIATRGRPYLAAFEKFTPCDERFEAMAGLVGDLVGAGIEVVVATHPMRSPLRDIAPPGAVADLDARIAEVAGAAGARVLRYTDLLPDTEMADMVHVSRTGSEVLTRRLAEDLGEGVGP